MSSELQAYDPNLQWAVHVIELTYMQWDFKATATVQIGGNCPAGSVLKSAIDRHAEDLHKQQGDWPVLVLMKTDASGEEDTLTCICDHYVRDSDKLPDIEAWLEEMCVGIRIVEQKAKERS